MSVASPAPGRTVTVHVPMKFSIRGGRKSIISGVIHDSGALSTLREDLRHLPKPRMHNALIQALARAHRWRQRIERGEYASIAELAKRENMNESYACRMLRLTLLSPSIIVNLLDCRSDLLLKHLMKPISIRWDEQVAELDRFRK